MNPELAYAAPMRARDQFHPDQDPSALLETFLPASPSDLAFDLSRVTSLFYGLMLQVAADRFGAEVVDDMSRELFYRLGRAKSRATVQDKAAQYTFHHDARDIVTILISAIYNASPEYEFSVEHFEPGLCAVRLSGTDRYYRAATSLGIAQHLTWPALRPFFDGINDELGLGCTVHAQVLDVGDDARLQVRYVFERP